MADAIDILRSQITEADLTGITPHIREEDGPRAAFTWPC